MRVALAAVVVAACGRVKFEPRGDAAGSASMLPDGALVVDDSGTAAGCGYIACTSGMVACCVNDRTSCVVDDGSSCTGLVYACNKPMQCSQNMFCCMPTSGGSFCAGICPPPM